MTSLQRQMTSKSTSRLIENTFFGRQEAFFGVLRHIELSIAEGLITVYIKSLNKAMISPLLEEMKPEYIILYEADLATIREIEVRRYGKFFYI